MKTPTSATEANSDVSAEAGFTLVEALCAFVILSLGFVSLFQGLNGAERNSGRLSEMAAERQIVRSLMAETNARPRDASIAARGRTGDYQWSVSLAPLQAGWVASAPQDRWRPYTVTYDVKGPRQSLELTSVRLLATR